MMLVEKIARALHDKEPVYSWLTWEELSKEGQRPYLQRAQLAIDITVEHFGIASGS